MKKNYLSRQLTGIVIIIVALLTLLLATELFALEDQGTTVKRDLDGCTVKIILQIGLQDATYDDWTRVKGALESCFNITCEIPCPAPSLQKCKVEVVLVVVTGYEYMPIQVMRKFHRVKMSSDPDEVSHVHLPLPTPNGISGSGDWKSNDEPKAYCHEALHLCGLEDCYCAKHCTYTFTEPNCPACPDPGCLGRIADIDCTNPENDKVRIKKICDGHNDDIMANIGPAQVLKCEHLLRIVSLAGLNFCPSNCCEVGGIIIPIDKLRLLEEYLKEENRCHSN